MLTGPENQEKPHNKFDPEFQTEKIAFDPSSMIVCKGCERENPPNRLNCIYCGYQLDVRVEDAALIKMNRRKLELWERGFNVIALERSTDNPSVDEIAAILSIDPSDVAAIINVAKPLPIARVESEKEAAIIVNSMIPLGLRCSVISDVDLSAENAPTRLCGMEDLNDSFALKDFNTGTLAKIAKTDLALIVPGKLTSGKVDSLESKRRGKDTKILAETTTADDEAILDIYTRSDSKGFRIRLAGFDFSCLGEKKGLLAADNIKVLEDLLKERSPNAKVVSDYSAIKNVLGIVWEVESRKDSRGLQRVGFGKTEFGAVATTNNLNQFTKYSRLQWHLL